MKVCMILTDGFEEMEAVGTYALLRRAGLTVDVYSLRGTKATGRFGLTCSEVQDFARFKDNGYAAVVLPGGPQYSRPWRIFTGPGNTSAPFAPARRF